MKTPQCATFTWNSCLSFCTLQALKIHNFKFQISIKFVSALFKLHTLSGEQWKSCLCLWMLLPLKIFYEKTNASIHLWLGPGSRPINIQNRTGSMCFIRFIVLPDNRTNDVVCTRVKKTVCNQDILNETKCPWSASFISDQAIWVIFIFIFMSQMTSSNLFSDVCVVVVIVYHKFRSETKSERHRQPKFFSQQTNSQRCSMRPWWCSQSLKHIWYLPVYSVSAPSPPEYIKLTTGTSLRKAIFLFLSCGQLPVSDRWMGI